MEGGTSAQQLVSNDVMGKSLRACITTRAFDDNTLYPSETEVNRREQAEQASSPLEQGDTLPLSAQAIPVHQQQHSNSRQTQVGTIERSLAQVSLSPYLTHNTPIASENERGWKENSAAE